MSGFYSTKKLERLEQADADEAALREKLER